MAIAEFKNKSLQTSAITKLFQTQEKINCVKAMIQ